MEHETVCPRRNRVVGTPQLTVQNLWCGHINYRLHSNREEGQENSLLYCFHAHRLAECFCSSACVWYFFHVPEFTANSQYRSYSCNTRGDHATHLLSLSTDCNYKTRVRSGRVVQPKPTKGQRRTIQ